MIISSVIKTDPQHATLIYNYKYLYRYVKSAKCCQDQSSAVLYSVSNEKVRMKDKMSLVSVILMAQMTDDERAVK